MSFSLRQRIALYFNPGCLFSLRQHDWTSFADSRRTGGQSLPRASRRQAACAVRGLPFHVSELKESPIGVDSGRGRNHRALDPRYPVARKIGHVGAAPRRARPCGIASFRARCAKGHRVEALYEDLGIKASKDLKRQPLTADSSDSQALPPRMARLRWPVHSRHDLRTRRKRCLPVIPRRRKIGQRKARWREYSG